MPHFILVEGGLGAGKTLMASVLAHYWRMKSGDEVRIFANYDLAGSTPFDSANRWLEVADARGSVIVWDEAQSQFDRRLWTRNTIATQIFNMTRKLRAVHIFVNPIGNHLDSRILDLVEVFIHVRKIPNRAILLDLYEFQDKRFGDWGRFVRTLRIPWHKVRQIFSLELYDTDQMLYPFPQPKTEREQTELLTKIADRQREAAIRERQGIEMGGNHHGWLNPSDHKREKDVQREREDVPDRSTSTLLPLSEYVSSNLVAKSEPLVRS